MFLHDLGVSLDGEDFFYKINEHIVKSEYVDKSRVISNKERKWGKTMLRKIKRIDIVYDEVIGYWYNKNGQLYATAQQLEIIDGELSYENYITGYKTAALGYEVIGEYYIVRQDGSCFE